MRLLPFIFTNTPPTDIYTLSLHDALPISPLGAITLLRREGTAAGQALAAAAVSSTLGLLLTVVLRSRDRKSTRLNSSHRTISYAVFCLKKKKNYITRTSYTLPM